MKLALLQNSLSYCVKEQKPCTPWVDKYFKDCLCNLRDEVSFACGLASLVCWAVAEIPQIITNFRTKSSHGVSLLFLVTWVAGDIFNLVGCLLEPATLPTQFYTALLYTATTIVLVLQSVYYDHIYRWWRGKHRRSKDHKQQVDDLKKPLKQANKPADSSIPIPTGTARASRRIDYYYTSARSLAGSATPPNRSHLRPIRSGPSILGVENDSSSEDEAVVEGAPKKAISQPKPIPRSAGYAAFLATSANMPQQSKALVPVYVGFRARKLLQAHESGSVVYGQWLGWMMAAIYMGGRLPQIWLNIKRGSVEGLNPFMFILAVIANTTYVGSILVRTTEWDKIKANMPWLLDAVACVMLDFFIISQYVYYRYLRKGNSGDEDYGDYLEANKG